MELKEFYIIYTLSDGKEIQVPIVCRKEAYDKVDECLTKHIKSPIDDLLKGLIEYHAVLLGLDPSNGCGRIYFPE